MRFFPRFSYPRENQIYILPTIYGFWYGVMTLLSLIIAFYYQNNMTFILGFLSLVFGLVSLIQTHFHLKDVPFNLEYIEEGHAKEQLRVEIRAQVDQTHESYGVERNKIQYKCDARGVIRVTYSNHLRGKHSFENIKVFTDFPFGLFKSWRWIFISKNYYSYPSLEGPLLVAENFTGENSVLFKKEMDDVSKLDKWRQGDSVRHILWRKTTPQSTLIVKKREDAGNSMPYLDIDHYLIPFSEKRLSQVTKTVHHYFKKRTPLVVLFNKSEKLVSDSNSYKEIMERLSEL